MLILDSAANAAEFKINSALQTRCRCFSNMSDTGMPTPSPIKVAIVEDRREIREGLALLINSTQGYNCVDSFRSMEEALPRIGLRLPDVALVDVGLPGMS